MPNGEPANRAMENGGSPVVVRGSAGRADLGNASYRAAV